MLDQEARALLTRLARIQPFALQETMLPAAGLLPEAQTAIERFLISGRRELHDEIGRYQRWLRGEGRAAPPSEMQRRYAILKLRFGNVISHFEVFSDAITQRSERENGVWLSGLDAVAQDALALPGYLDPPPVICYLDRGTGGAIRRARTRLPGGKRMPVAVVRMPRERMIGDGIASSLVHEVGHQGAALLGLVTSLRRALGQAAPAAGRDTWRVWERWTSEIVADLWAVARVGITSTLGLISVVSLPRFFVFRIDLHDPHPAPWLRVKLSCALGNAIYPHPQWAALARVWEDLYPLQGLDPGTLEKFQRLQRTIPRVAQVLCAHRTRSLRGRPLASVLASADRTPRALLGAWRQWRRAPAQMFLSAPSLVFAALGQARLVGELEPERESRILADLLTHWALRSTLDLSQACAALTAERRRAAALQRPVEQLPAVA
jgi:hypothetical protein